MVIGQGLENETICRSLNSVFQRRNMAMLNCTMYVAMLEDDLPETAMLEDDLPETAMLEDELPETAILEDDLPEMAMFKDDLPETAMLEK